MKQIKKPELFTAEDLGILLEIWRDMFSQVPGLRQPALAVRRLRSGGEPGEGSVVPGSQDHMHG